MYKLVFKIGEETIPTVLNIDNYSSSPFSDQLETGIKLLTDLLEKWRNRKASLKNTSEEQELNFSEQPVDNNIISFLGERGSGKTSCLYSIKEIFSHPKYNVDFSKDTEFLNIIDPSFFDEHHNILEIFIGELYHEYEKMVKNWELMPKTERQEVRELHGWFAKVRQSIKFINVQKLELPEDQEGLSALSEGVNLRLLVSGLVNAFLLCKKKKYLVVSIDDIDLNIREAYRMMEQIRKYLVVPNVVIFMAAKLNQLKNSIVLNLTEYYKAILPSIIDLHGIQTMADRYLDKFIPLERRINMPTFNDHSLAHLDIIGKNESVPSPDFQFESVEFAVLSLIYKKCGYLFYNYEETPSLIIPENLRELRSFVTMLFEMGERTDSTTHLKNKNLFKEYLYVQWLQYLPNDQQEIARNILKEKDPTKINKTIVDLLYGYAKSLGMSKDLNKSEKTNNVNLTLIRLKEIENHSDYSENISIGDVMAILDHLNNVAGSIRINHLIFFVKTFYSMKLYELYDEMTEAIDNENTSKQDNDNSTPSTESTMPLFPKLKSSKDYGIYNFFKVVGNGFFTLTGESFLPPAKNRAYSRELSLMNGNLLFEVIDDLVMEYEKDKNVLKNQWFLNRLKLAEFFMLCASRIIESKDGSYSPFIENNWRAEYSEFYFYPFDSGIKTILFDVTAPFVNLCIPKIAYRRFNNKIVDIAMACDGSIISQLYKQDKRTPSQNDEHNLVSRSAIRNIEVLNDIHLWLIKRRDIFNDDRDNDLNILTKFFKSFNGLEDNKDGYTVSTYELNKGKNDYHTIDFTSFKVLAKFLDSISVSSNKEVKGKSNKELEELFMRIYRKENLLAADTLYNLTELIRILRDSKESDIPTKDNIISNVLRRTKGRISSNLLVEYLAELNIAEKVVFSTYFDNTLFSKYKTLVTDNLNRHKKNLERIKNELEQRWSSFESDKRKIESEHKHIDTQIASVKSRQKSEKAKLDEIESEIRQLILQTDNIKMKVNELYPLLSILKEEFRKLDTTFKGYTLEQKQREEELHQKETDLIKKGIPDDIQASLKKEIKKLRKVIIDIAETKENHRLKMEKKSKEIDRLSGQITQMLNDQSQQTSIINKNQNESQNLKNKIEQDEAIFQNLYRDAKILKQREFEIKAALDANIDKMKIHNAEYEIFIRKRTEILSTLSNRAS